MDTLAILLSILVFLISSENEFWNIKQMNYCSALRLRHHPSDFIHIHISGHLRRGHFRTVDRRENSHKVCGCVLKKIIRKCRHLPIISFIACVQDSKERANSCLRSRGIHRKCVLQRQRSRHRRTSRKRLQWR